MPVLAKIPLCLSPMSDHPLDAGTARDDAATPPRKAAEYQVPSVYSAGQAVRGPSTASVLPQVGTKIPDQRERGAPLAVAG